MGMPKDVDARRYYRVAYQRLEDAELIHLKIRRPSLVVYLAGYAVECILKAMIVAQTPEQDRMKVLRSLKKDLGHDLAGLATMIKAKTNIPKDVARNLVYVSTWSPNLRYEPGLGDPGQAEAFLRSAKAIIQWADERI